MKEADFFTRLVALFLDWIVLMIVEIILPASFLYYEILPVDFQSDIWESLVRLEFALYAPVYFISLRYFNDGQTLGKKLMKIRTTDESGGKLRFWQSAVDCAGYMFLPLDVLVGLLFSSTNQRFTQMCSGTFVREDD